MKTTAIYTIIASFAIFLCACNNGQQNQESQTTQKSGSGKKFRPEERVSSLSDEERDSLLTEKKMAATISMDSLLYGHGVRFSVLEPVVQGDITQSVSERIGCKLLEIASQNGISGTGTNPSFVFGTEISQTGRAATGTAPQKMTVKYDLTYKVMNAVSGDVYATAIQSITGVGNSFEEASQNAVKEIKNTPALQKMLKTANDRIIQWYNDNVQVVKNQVEKAEADGDFALALATLSSVPEQAKAAHDWASQKQPNTLEKMLHKKAADMLGEMRAALASSGDEFNPEVGAYFQLIPSDSPEYQSAKQIYAEYEKRCADRKAVLEAKAERDEEAARELEKLRLGQEHEKELAEIEADKIKTKYEAKANAAAMEREMRRESDNKKGFWGSLGSRIIGGIDWVANKITGNDDDED